MESGLVQNWRAQVAGELLAELVRLGKEVLSDRTEEAKNVSAVLIAASFEGHRSRACCEKWVRTLRAYREDPDLRK